MTHILVLIFCANYENHGETKGQFSHSPSDKDTLELEEFSDFLFTNEVTQVNAIDESSNSSTAEYTELVSLSVTNEGK